MKTKGGSMQSGGKKYISVHKQRKRFKERRVKEGEPPSLAILVYNGVSIYVLYIFLY